MTQVGFVFVFMMEETLITCGVLSLLVIHLSVSLMVEYAKDDVFYYTALFLAFTSVASFLYVVIMLFFIGPQDPSNRVHVPYNYSDNNTAQLHYH